MSVAPARASARGTTAVRAVLLGVLAFTSGGPFLLLVVRSLSGRWFFPAIVPDDWATGGWRLLADGGALSRALWFTVAASGRWIGFS